MNGSRIILVSISRNIIEYHVQKPSESPKVTQMNPSIGNGFRIQKPGHDHTKNERRRSSLNHVTDTNAIKRDHHIRDEMPDILRHTQH